MPVPPRARDVAGDGGERLVGSPLELEVVSADGDDVLDALPIPQQSCAGQWPVIRPDPTENHVAAVQLLAQRLEPRPGLRLQPTISQFLDPIGQAALDVGPAKRRRLLAEQLPPLLLQRRDGRSM
jgi:hypothetical protein